MGGKKFFSIIIVLTALALFIFSLSKTFAANALEVANQFLEAAMDADFKALSMLSCRDSGPYLDYKYAKEKIDIKYLICLNKVIRQEDSEIDPDNLKIVVAGGKIMERNLSVAF